MQLNTVAHGKYHRSLFSFLFFLSIFLFFLSIYPSISVCLSVFICLSACLSVCVSVCLSVSLSVSVSVSLSLGNYCSTHPKSCDGQDQIDSMFLFHKGLKCVEELLAVAILHLREKAIDANSERRRCRSTFCCPRGYRKQARQQRNSMRGCVKHTIFWMEMKINKMQ